MASKLLFPYQRLAYIFDTIKNELLPQKELANRFSVSIRTIRSDIVALNDVLHTYGAKVDYVKNVGYHLVISDSSPTNRIPE
ncbi:hypothetical protein GASC598I20_002890 [Gilliamella apicola SCGC AB-598-I20]|nr:hypothetical protein GASC598I20_002890 [Gilliamella apicola SCGC AB-598-I20]